MNAIAELEFDLDGLDGRYYLEMRYVPPDEEVDRRYGPVPVVFPLGALQQAELDAARYGRLLAENLLAEPGARIFFETQRADSESKGAPLRLRLVVSEQAADLHGLRWEALRDPQTGNPLLTGERFLFSRYLSSQDHRPVYARPEGTPRALVAIANPRGLEAYDKVPQRGGGTRALAEIKVDAERQRARQALEGLAEVRFLDQPGTVTLQGLCERLMEEYDVLYLVCHGALIEGAPRLWLEDERGAAAVVAGEELAAQLARLRRPPRLVVLASCQSAGGGTPERSADGGALAALGPRLARAGAAAVLAMQDDVAMTTAAAFLPAFFRELRRPEWLWQVDRAAAVARGAVADEQERWKPVLFMRLKNGRLWHVPQAAQPWPKFEKWPSVLNNIYQERCTPVLGPGLLEAFIGPARQLAHDWARDHGFPLAAYLQEDLAQVAQYLAVIQQVGFPRERLARHIRERLLADPQLRTPAGPLPSPDNLDDLISAVGRVRRERDPAEPHRVLARLPSKVYITANPDRLLADALRGAGRDPRVDLCPWSDEVDWPRPVQEREPNYTPTREQPLIYHLFGHFALPESLVLTQDDYFDFLIGVTRNKALIPKPILRARADTALLFLGFRMDDWNFKVLFRSIMSQEAGRRRTQYAHVGVQIDPVGTEFADPGRARQYLERYFQDADLSIFWGSVEDFIRQLQERLE